MSEEAESWPFFRVYELSAGHVLTSDDVKDIQSLLSELNTQEEIRADEFHKGREDALMEIGGADLLTAVQMKDHERIAHHVRKAMDKLFPKERRTQQ